MPSTLSFDEPLEVFPVPSVGAEDVLVSRDGQILTGTADGTIYALDPPTGAVRVVARTGGRPLGLEWGSDGRVLVCDAYKGLLALDRATGVIETLVLDVAGRPMRFCDNAAVHSDGTVFFSDSSRRHSIDSWKRDLVEDTHSGRLLARRPDGRVTVILDGLRFANGVALAADESYVAVAETNGRNIVRRWLTGTRRGRVEDLVTDLPGYPDNISRGTDGLIWVAIASPPDPAHELALRRLPLGVRATVARAPDRFLPQPKRTARVQAYDDQGRLVHDRQFRADGFHLVTGVREQDGTVWLGSLVESAVARFEVH